MPPRKKAVPSSSDRSSSQPSQPTKQSASIQPTRRSRRIQSRESSKEPEDLPIASNPVPPAATTRTTRSQRTPSATLSDADDSNADTDVDQPKPSRAKKAKGSATKKTGPKAKKSSSKKSSKRATATGASELDVPDTITEEIAIGDDTQDNAQDNSVASQLEDVQQPLMASEDVGDAQLEDVSPYPVVLQLDDAQQRLATSELEVDQYQSASPEPETSQHPSIILEELEHVQYHSASPEPDTNQPPSATSEEFEDVQYHPTSPGPEEIQPPSATSDIEDGQHHPASLEPEEIHDSSGASEKALVQHPEVTPEPTDSQLFSGSPESSHKPKHSEWPQILPPQAINFPSSSPLKCDNSSFNTQEKTSEDSDGTCHAKSEPDESVNDAADLESTDPARCNLETLPDQPTRIDRDTQTEPSGHLETNSSSCPIFPQHPVERDYSRMILRHLAQVLQHESADMPEANLKIAIKRHFFEMVTDDIVDIVYELSRYGQERSKTVSKLREEASSLETASRYHAKRHVDMIEQNSEMSKAKADAETHLEKERSKSFNLGKENMDLKMSNLSYKRKRDESEAQQRILEAENERVLQAARTLKPWIKLEVKGDDFKVLGVNSQDAERIRRLLIWGPAAGNEEEQKFLDYLLSTIPVWEHETISNVREAVKYGRVPDKNPSRGTERLEPIGRIQHGRQQTGRLGSGLPAPDNLDSHDSAEGVDKDGQHMMSGGMNGMPTTPKSSKIAGQSETESAHGSWSVSNIWRSTVGKFFGSPSATKEQETPARTTSMFDPPRTAPAGKPKSGTMSGVKKRRRRVFTSLAPEKHARRDQTNAYKVLGISKENHMSSDNMPDLSRFDRYRNDFPSEEQMTDAPEPDSASHDESIVLPAPLQLAGIKMSKRKAQVDDAPGVVVSVSSESPGPDDVSVPLVSVSSKPDGPRRRVQSKLESDSQDKTQIAKQVALDSERRSGRWEPDQHSIPANVLAQVKSELQRGIEDAYEVKPEDRWSTSALGKRKRMITVRISDLVQPDSIITRDSTVSNTFGLGAEEPFADDDLDDEVEVPEEFAARFLRPSKRSRLEENSSQRKRMETQVSFGLDDQWQEGGGAEETDSEQLLTTTELAMMEEVKTYKGNIPDSETDDELLSQLRAEVREDNFRCERGLTREAWQALKARYQQHLEKVASVPAPLEVSPKASSTMEATTPPPDNVFGTADGPADDETTSAGGPAEHKAAPKTPGNGDDSNALARARSQAERYKPKTPSGLREASRVSTPASTLASPSKAQPARLAGQENRLAPQPEQHDDATISSFVDACEALMPEPLAGIFGRVGPGSCSVSSEASVTKIERLMLRAEQLPEFKSFGIAAKAHFLEAVEEL